MAAPPPSPSSPTDPSAAALASAGRSDGRLTSPGYGRAFAIVTTLFFMWGFLTVLNDVLIPHLKAIFDLTYVQAALIQFAFFGAYFIMAVPSDAVIERIGYKGAMVAGLVTAGVGAALFWPAAAFASYPLFLGALFVLASGITLLQTSANPYVTALGPPGGASARLNLTQAFNSLGTTLGPLFGGLLILGATLKTPAEMAAMAPDALAAYRAQEAATVQLPYVGLAVALVVLAGLIYASKLPRLAGVEDTGTAGTYGEALGVRHLLLGVVGIFLYVGAEVSIGSFLVNFLGAPNVAGLPEETAARYLSLYWGGAMVGRFIGAAVLRRIDPGRALAFAAGVAALLCLVGASAGGGLAMWGVLAIGLFNSIMFPTIFALAVAGLGRLTGKGSSLLVMAIVGGALLPLAMGALIDRFGLQPSFLLPFVCYLYIAYYGLRGSRPATA